MKAWPIDPLVLKSFKVEVSEKLTRETFVLLAGVVLLVIVL